MCYFVFPVHALALKKVQLPPVSAIGVAPLEGAFSTSPFGYSKIEKLRLNSNAMQLRTMS